MKLRAAIAVVLALFAVPGVARAAWSTNPEYGHPAVSTANTSQLRPLAIPDGAGGVHVLFHLSSTNTAQHLIGVGAIDPAWPTAGRPMTAPSSQGYGDAASDGAGGVYASWTQYYTPGNLTGVFVQRVNAAGAIADGWPASGLRIEGALTSYVFDPPRIVADGAGGAIVCWVEFDRALVGPDTIDVYAQHVLPDGTIDPAWPYRGRALCAAPGEQSMPFAIADGEGGAIVAWEDYRGGATRNVYAQRVSIDGIVDPDWPVNGAPISTANQDQRQPALLLDGAGGFYAEWRDNRFGGNDLQFEIYANRFNMSDGQVGAGWPAAGVPLNVGQGAQGIPKLATDGANGMYAVWVDSRPGLYVPDIYATHLLPGGVVDPNWPINGLPVCQSASKQTEVRVIADGVGGAIIGWRDDRTYGEQNISDIYAQRVLPGGTVDPAWPVDGQAISTEYWLTNGMSMAEDGAGGAILVWQQYPGSSGSARLYAGRIGRDGTLGGGGVVGVPTTPAGGSRLDAPRPRPSSGAVALGFRTAVEGVVRLEVHDLKGRRIRTLVDGALPAGEHAAAWDGRTRDGSRAPAGVYFARLRAPAGPVLQQRVVLLAPR